MRRIMSKKLSLCMIVKNEEKYLTDCFSSVQDVVDEIVLVDTGSTDQTLVIAEAFSAKIFQFDWVNDFAAARNFALSKCSGDLILYLDADERLNESSLQTIRQIKNSDDNTAYLCTVVSLDRKNSRDNSMQYVRLFPNIPEISFSGKVHEQIVPSLKEKGIRIVQSGVVIIHIGYNVSEEIKREKAKRNIYLLEKEYSFNNSAYYAFQLANAYVILDDIKTAEKYFLIAAHSPELNKSHRANCFASLALLSHNNNDSNRAESFITQALKFGQEQPFNFLLASKIALRNGNLSAADERCFKAYEINKKLKRKPNHLSISILLDDEEIVCFGLSLALLQNNTKRKSFFEKELISLYDDSISELISNLLLKKSFQQYELNSLKKMMNKNNINLFINLMNVHPDRKQMIGLLESLIEEFPNESDIFKTLANLYDQEEQTDTAIFLLENHLSKFENDPALYFYLITFYLKKGQLEKIELTLDSIEQRFSNVPEVINRLNIIQKKLNSFIKIT